MNDIDDRIHVDPNILVGKPVIRGTRIAVEFVIDLLAARWTHEQILSNYPPNRGMRYCSSRGAGQRQRVGRVRNWQSGSMALRWSSCAFEAASKQFRKVMGHQQLWMLNAHLDAITKEEQLEQIKQAGKSQPASPPLNLQLRARQRHKIK